MKKLLLIGLPLLLASCASSHRPPAPRPPSVPQLRPVFNPTRHLFGFEATPDSLPLAQVTRTPGRLGRLLGRQPQTTRYPLGTPGIVAGKNSTITINQVQGAQHNTTASAAKNAHTLVGDGASNTEAGRQAGPITQAGPGATVHVASTKKGPAQAGQANRATEASGWPWWLWLLLAAVAYAGSRLYKRFTPI